MTEPDGRDPPGALVVRLASRLVPAARRQEWLAEWRTELTHSNAWRLRGGEPSGRVRWSLRRRALGSVVDAWTLRVASLRGGALRQHVREAVRLPGRHPGFVAAVVLTLGLGIGAVTALFTVVDGLVLRPLPFRAPEQLVAVARGEGPYPNPLLTPDSVAAWRTRRDVFADGAAYRHRTTTLTGPFEPRLTSGAWIEPGFLELLGIAPLIGRGFLPEDAVPGRDRVVMIGEALWRDGLGADRSAIGRTLWLDGTPHTVIGVFPSTLRVLPTGRVTLATPFSARLLPAETAVSLIGRVLPGLTARDAEGRMAVGRAGGDLPGQPEPVRLVPLGDTRILAGREGLPLLMAAAALLLGIACANAAGLLLIRGIDRQEELAVRLALGASRTALLTQLLVESAFLSVLAGGVGTLLGYAGMGGLLAIVPPGLVESSYTVVRMDMRVLVFAVSATVATGILFGTLPALTVARGSGRTVRSGGRMTASTRHRRLRSGLVVFELALAVALLAGAGLLGNSFVRLAGRSSGVDDDRLLVARLALTSSPYADPAAREAFRRRLDDRLRSVPGVRAVSFTLGGVPPSPGFMRDVAMETEDGPHPLPILAFARVDAAYFQTLRTPLLEGRPFAQIEERGTVILDTGLARVLWPDGRALGRRLRIRPEDPWLTVVGVAADVRLSGPDDRYGAHELYLPLRQDSLGRIFQAVVRTTGPAGPMAATVRETVRSMDPDMPIAGLEPASALYATALRQRRYILSLVGTFTFLALALAIVGIHGVVAYDVARRVPEIAIRAALGAGRTRIVGEVLRSGLTYALAGIAIGVAAFLAISRFLAGYVYGIRPTDPLTLGAVALSMVVLCTIALAVPAVRAARIPPAGALRADH